MDILVQAVRRLSMARTLQEIMEIVRHSARAMSRADGATFILREGDICYYAEEDAIKPLWKGMRFPVSVCVSGWTMNNRKPVVIEDVYSGDVRIPLEAFRPTFVKSMVMVPIRAESPIGAIGTYWAERHVASPEEVEMLQALADTTAVAMENVEVYQELERRIQERTSALEFANRELEAFAASVSHDLRSPLGAILGGAEFLQGSAQTRLTSRELGCLDDIRHSALRMRELIEDLLRLSKMNQSQVSIRRVDITALAGDILAGIRARDPIRRVAVSIAEDLSISGDPGLIHIALENLFSNAWKYTSSRADAWIEMGQEEAEDGATVVYVRDNGVGFDMESARRMFEPFQRLETAQGFSGTGIGLLTVQRIMSKHGGKVWAESERGKGATFFLSFPAASDPLRFRMEKASQAIGS